MLNSRKARTVKFGLITIVTAKVVVQSKDFRVLELGCGAGANVHFFKKLGIHYYAIEGSAVIVNKLHEQIPDLRDVVKVGDFTKEIPFDQQFDLIVDRASLTHNSTAAIKHCLKIVTEKLIPGGIFIGIDWFSTQHTEYSHGVFCEDVNTRSGFERGQFLHVGKVHFSDKKHLYELFKAYNFEVLEHKIVQREIPEENNVFASWNFVARKK